MPSPGAGGLLACTGDGECRSDGVDMANRVVALVGHVLGANK